MGIVEAVIGAALIGAGTSVYQGQQQKKAANKVNAQAQQNAIKQEQAADQATNRANQKRANPTAALDAAAQAGKGGASGTMLTGPSGIDPNALTLGKTTLLGA